MRASLFIPASVLVAILATAGCSISPTRSNAAVGMLPQVVNESSGLVGSSDGTFMWTHNDSGDTARIFAIDFRGRLLGEVAIRDAMSSDWEAVTIDDAGRLLIGDIGNNENQRRDLMIYVIPEPRPSMTEASAVERIHFRYPEQRSFPDRDRFNFDAEALFWWNGRLFVLTKHRSDQDTVLYMFPRLSAGIDPVDLEKVSQATMGSMVTDAAVSPDGTHLAVLTYAGITIFELPEDGWDLLAQPVKRIDFDTSVSQQCEGLAWVGDSLYMSNEQRYLYRLRDPMAESFVTYP